MLRKIGIAIHVLWIKTKQIFRRHRPGNILIIKPDAIGDYILFRNFLQVLAGDEKYADSKITLVGNTIWKDFALKFDAEAIDRFIAVNHKTLAGEWIELFDEVNKVTYDLVITFCYSRSFMTDIIALTASSRRKIGLRGDNIRMNGYLKYLFDKTVYNDLVDVPGELKTEFEFNRLLAEHIVARKLDISQPILDIKDSAEPFVPGINSPYVVFAPGAGVWNRQPDATTLGKIAGFVLEKYSLCFVGTPEESALVDQIIQGLPLPRPQSIINLTGKLPLKEIPQLLSGAKGVICNDSAIYHLSMALDRPTLCIAGGGHFDRFVNYTRHQNLKICYQQMPCFNCDWFCVFKFPDNGPYPCIAGIDTDYILDNFLQLETLFGA